MLCAGVGHDYHYKYHQVSEFWSGQYAHFVPVDMRHKTHALVWRLLLLYSALSLQHSLQPAIVS